MFKSGLLVLCLWPFLLKHQIKAIQPKIYKHFLIYLTFFCHFLLPQNDRFVKHVSNSLRTRRTSLKKSNFRAIFKKLFFRGFSFLTLVLFKFF